jgi:uncharacterized protein
MPAAPRCAPVVDSQRDDKIPRLRDVQDIVDLILDDPFRRAVIEAARSLGLRDGAIGAGFVRQPVWDHLHGYQPSEKFADIDVLYFNALDTSPLADLRFEKELAQRLPGVPWSVKNQARMHLRNGEHPYRDTEDAIAHWLERSTAVAVALPSRAPKPLLAPYGVDDLLNLILAPTPSGTQRAQAYRDRLREKRMHVRWPKITVFDADGSRIDAERLQREFE